MTRSIRLRDGLIAGGAPRMWERIVRENLPSVRAEVPPGSRVLEVGYGDGLLSCYMAAEMGWQLTGLDVRPAAADAARAAARAHGLDTQVEFRLVQPETIRSHAGSYDAMFVKTVFYSSSSLDEYRSWLDRVCRVLRPGGVLVNYETGRANSLTQAYRRLRGREYTDLSLYTSIVEALYDERFSACFRRYYGGLSQFAAPIPRLYEALARMEETLVPRNADNCFVVSAVLRKK